MAVELAVIFFSMILVDNYVLVQFLGICPFLGVSKRLDSAVGMSLAVTFVMVLATAATWPSQMFLLTPESGAWDMGYLQTIVFILIIAVLVQLLESILKKYIPALYKSLGVYLPLITTNCTILGVTVLNIDNGYDFLESIACAAVCPNHVIEVVPEHKRKPVVLCQNKDKGAQTRKACTAGCIGCMKCAKACPREAITVENNVAYIDQEKCVGCQLCVKECPVGVIHVPAAM